MKLQPFLVLNTIIDNKETRKTGLGLIFVGILSIFIYLLFLDCFIHKKNLF